MNLLHINHSRLFRVFWRTKKIWPARDCRK